MPVPLPDGSPTQLNTAPLTYSYLHELHDIPFSSPPASHSFPTLHPLPISVILLPSIRVPPSSTLLYVSLSVQRHSDPIYFHIHCHIHFPYYPFHSNFHSPDLFHTY